MKIDQRISGAAQQHVGVGVVITMMFLVGCKRQSPPKDSIFPPKDLASVSITLARMSGNLPSPSYTVVMHGSGAVEYEGKDRVPVLGRRNTNVPQDKVLALVQEVDRMKFMSAKERDFSVIDAPSLTLTVSVDGKTTQMKSVASDGFSFPSEDAVKKMSPLARAQLNFMKLADDVGATTGIERWTKCSPACMMYIFHSGNPKSSNGEALLVSEIERKEPEVLGNISIPAQALVEAGADVNLANSQGTTPLMAAAKKGDVDLLRDLLTHGADRNAKDKKGRIALDFAHNAEARAILSLNHVT